MVTLLASQRAAFCGLLDGCCSEGLDFIFLKTSLTHRSHKVSRSKRIVAVLALVVVDSATRFVKISPLWQNFGRLLQYFVKF